MLEWYCNRDGTQFGPFTAKKLKRLAEESQLRPTDLIRATGGWVGAEKIAGLINETVAPPIPTINVVWPGIPLLFSATIAVRFDDVLIGNGSMNKGFNYTIPTTVGQHTLGIKPSIIFKREKKYPLCVGRPADYGVIIFYNAFFGTFSDECRLNINTDALHAQTVAQDQWNDERQKERCPSCGADWAVICRGKKDMGQRRVEKMVHETSIVQMENPEFYKMDADRGTPQLLHGDIQRSVQRIVAVNVVRLFYKCEKCPHKWTADIEAQ